MHDRPDPEELIIAVRELLADEVLGVLDGRTKFRVRVAMNVLDIVARQLTSGPTEEEAHRQRLKQLGYHDDEALCSDIRSGALDDRYDEVADAIRRDAWDKVGVVNPLYRRPYQSIDEARERLPSASGED